MTMDTGKLKRFAVEARTELLSVVRAKVNLVRGEYSFARRNTPKAVKALDRLIAEIGEDQAVEKVAYTWFNRFIALRFMDVRHYTKMGIVSPVNGGTQPEVLAEAKGGYVDKSVVSEDIAQRIFGLLNGHTSAQNPQSDAYKLLLVAYCNYYNRQMPFMFEKINDYTDLLLPDDLLSQSSVLTKTVATLDELSCQDVEVIGWLYQYFNQEEKDRVIKAKKRYKGFEIPYATQLFTPNWIVRYMTQNSLGRLWMEANPQSDLKEKMEFYLEAQDQSAENKQLLAEHIFKGIKPENIKVFDPACGSGHVLVYAFDILLEIYKSQGWAVQDIPEAILTHNLYGLDICERAATLAQFALIMKAWEYDRYICNKIQSVNICPIQNTQWITTDIIDDLLEGCPKKEAAREQIFSTCEQFNQAKIIGSLCKIDRVDPAFWRERLAYFNNVAYDNMNTPYIREHLTGLVKQLEIMSRQYECVITNPPYMGGKYMEPELSEFVSKEYPDVKADLFSAFVVYCQNKTIENGYLGFMTPFVWMFISSYECLRHKIITDTNITSLVQLEYSGFDGATVPICTFTLAKRNIPSAPGCYVRLSDFPGAKNQPIKTREAVLDHNCGFYYEVPSDGFEAIPGAPIAYWASEKFISNFLKEKIGDTWFSGGRNKTHNNEKYLRLWWEISDKLKWQPYDKGGIYRKWYGNHEYVVDWSTSAKKEYDSHGGLYNQAFANKIGICWTLVTSSANSFRVKLASNHYDSASPVIFNHTYSLDKYVLAFLNTKVADVYLKCLNPTMNMGNTYVLDLPIIWNNRYRPEIEGLIEENIAISKDDWDSFETSWDFQTHPLLRFKEHGKIEDAFKRWKAYKQTQFDKLKANEEELNRLFINIYGLADEMSPEVEDKDITVALADEVREIKSLISYAVGCMFGRYSLDKPGLICAGGTFCPDDYKIFPADEDNAIPVLPDNYFTDDIVGRFYNFISVAFGAEHLGENIAYISSVLGKKSAKAGNAVLRDYFIKDFYADHVRIYQKRPIYWMFSSAKNGFNTLIYLHRYNKDTVNIILNDYLREYNNKLRANIETATAVNASAADNFHSNDLQIRLNEAEDYERQVLFPLASERKEIDPDDGVKVNYLKFGKALRDFGLKEKTSNV